MDSKILDLRKQGKSYDEIARTLHISKPTVKYQLELAYLREKKEELTRKEKTLQNKEEKLAKLEKEAEKAHEVLELAKNLNENARKAKELSEKIKALEDNFSGLTNELNASLQTIKQAEGCKVIIAEAEKYLFRFRKHVGRRCQTK